MIAAAALGRERDANLNLRVGVLCGVWLPSQIYCPPPTHDLFCACNEFILNQKFIHECKHGREPMCLFDEPGSPKIRIRRTWFEPSLSLQNS